MAGYMVYWPGEQIRKLKKAKDTANGANEKVLTREEKVLGNNFDLSI